MTRRAPRALPLAVGLAAWCAAHAPAWAQDEGGAGAARAPGLRIVPSVYLAETLTDNRRLRTDKQGDAITEGRLGLRALLPSGRVTGFVDYGLTGLAYARDSALNDVRHQLATALNAELLPQHAFLDVRGTIQQRSASAFGTQSLAGTTRGDSNRVETATGSISPSWRGRLGPWADIEARYALLGTRSSGTDAGDQTTQTASVHIGDSVPRGLSWAVDATHREIDYVIARDTVHDSVVATLSAVPDPDVTAAVFAGVDSTDLVSLERERHTTYGVQTRWTPSERTQVDARYARTFFGNSHDVHVTHRTPRTVWLFADTRALSSQNGQAAVRLGTAYDLMFQQFASVEPDPRFRDVLVRNFLAARGIDPQFEVQLGLLVSAVTLQRERSLAFSLLGRRTTAIVRISRHQTSRLTDLDLGSGGLADLATSSSVRQDVVGLNVGHRLTPTDSLDFTAGWQRSRGDAPASFNTLRTALVTWSSQRSPRTRVSLALRRAEFDSPQVPYDENALLASLRHEF